MSITKKMTRKRGDDVYFDLVQRFPLRPIRSETQHLEAVRCLTTISMAHQRTRNQDVLDYMETLAKLIEEYERKAEHGPDLSKLTPVSALNHLMEVHGLNVSQMAALLGTTQGTLSDIRTGHRRSGLSKQMIRRLVDRFGVDAELFL